MRILLINGPNLNLLGNRENSIYGNDTLEDIEKKLSGICKENGVSFNAFQSNAEHEIVEKVHKANEENVSKILMNPGAFTHTSISIRDAISIFSQNNKFIEVHISDINKREDFRQVNLIKEFSEHSIIGQGVKGYMKALEYIDGQ